MSSTHKSRWVTPLLLAVVGVNAACSLLFTSKEEVPVDSVFDADADADSDRDRDSDSDSDSDSDADRDGGTNADADDEVDLDVDGLCRPVPASILVSVVGEEEPVLRADLGAPGFLADDITCDAWPDDREIAFVDFDDSMGTFEPTGDVRLDPDADRDNVEGEAGLRLCATGATVTLRTSIAGIGTDLLEVDFYARNWNLGNGEFLRAEFSTDGTNFDLFGFVGDDILRGDQWQHFDNVLPQMLAHDDLWIRFTRIGGYDDEDCADIDNLRIIARGFAVLGAPLLSEDFEDGYGVFSRTGPLFDSDIRTIEGGHAVELVCSSDGSIFTSFPEPDLGEMGRIAISWRWQEEPFDELTAGKYVLAEYSDDGSSWLQMAAIGLEVTPSSMMSLWALLPLELSDDVHIRFISPTSNDNSGTQGALVDDIEAVHIDLQPDGVLEPLVEVEDGVFEADISQVLAGSWWFSCTWSCGSTTVLSSTLQHPF